MRGKLVIWGLALAALTMGCSGGNDPTPTATATSPEPTVAQDPTPTPGSTSTPNPAAANFEPAGCRFARPSGVAVECGYLTVPEERSNPDGPTIQLHVATFTSLLIEPALDPVVYLGGGPGENSILARVTTFRRQISPWLQTHRLIVIDQRGTGFSLPALNCPEATEARRDALPRGISPEEGLRIGTESIQACHDRLEHQGINLAAFNSTESAADLTDLRQALGYEEWNLYGVSYGTRLALTAMRDTPEGLRSVILDSAYPLEADLYSETPPNINRAFNLLFSACATDPVCGSPYNGLEATLSRVVEQLNETPLLTTIRNPLDSHQFDILVTGDIFVHFLIQTLYISSVIPLIPEIIFDAEDGNLDLAAILMGNFLVNEDLQSLGMHLSVQCNGEAAFTPKGAAARAADPFPLLKEIFDNSPTGGKNILALCQGWGSGKPGGPEENAPVQSSIPTLVLAGEHDPITPPAWGRQVAAAMENSFFFEFPGLGHGVALEGDCTLSIVRDFLSHPTRAPESRCLADFHGPRFLPRSTDVALVPFETAQAPAISGIRPVDWMLIAPGSYSRTELSVVGLIQQAVQGLGPDQVLELLASQLGLESVPDLVSNIQANGLNWDIYRAITQVQPLDLAITHQKGTTVFILLTTTPYNQDLYYKSVFLPAIDALVLASE